MAQHSHWGMDKKLKVGSVGTLGLVALVGLALALYGRHLIGQAIGPAGGTTTHAYSSLTGEVCAFFGFAILIISLVALLGLVVMQIMVGKRQSDPEGDPHAPDNT